MFADLATGIGLLLTLIGAIIAASSVMLSEDDAIQIGLSRHGSTDRTKNLSLPMVKNLLSASRGARNGLWLVAFGTLIQIAPIGFRLISVLI